METMILVMEATLPLLTGFMCAALLFVLFASMFPKGMQKVVAIIFGSILVIAFSTQVYERYDLLKDYPEDIAIFTDSNLENMLKNVYISDCKEKGEANEWNNYVAHRYYRSYAKFVSEGEELCEFLKDHKVISIEYLPADGKKLQCQNKKTGEIVTKTFVSKRQEFEQNHTVLSVDGKSVVCRNKKTGEIVTLKRELSVTTTNWSSI